MAVAKLHYAGGQHHLDVQRASEFVTRLTKALDQVGDGVELVEAPLTGGGSMLVAVSKSIPIAIERRGHEHTTPTAMFV